VGYFKTLYMGKIACLNAHALKLVLGDCWVEIFTLAWQRLNINNMAGDVKINKNLLVFVFF